MPFSFIRYITPAWYFRLPPAGDHAYFPDYDALQPEQQALIDFSAFGKSSVGYKTRNAAIRDAAYQAWRKGFVLESSFPSIPYNEPNEVIEDNYRFVRRFFHPLWSWYILGLRLLTLHQPIREIFGFWKQRHTVRINVYEKVFPRPIPADDSVTFPFISVIIPTLNRYDYLKAALHDLEQQDYPHFEVIVVDQSAPFREDFYNNFQLNLRVLHQEEKALWLARNRAIEEARANLLLFFDDDSRVASDWIRQHWYGLNHFHSDISSGVSISAVGSRPPVHYSFFRWSDQLDTGNVLIKRDVFEEIGLFDRQFERQRMGDSEFGLRAYLAGFRNISNPEAVRLHLKAAEGGLRQMGSWDGFRPTRWYAPRPVPSVLYLVRKYFGNRAALTMLSFHVPASVADYKHKSRYHLPLEGLKFLLLIPVLSIQVIMSWRRSSDMLKEKNAGISFPSRRVFTPKADTSQYRPT
jgi:GT2 family glycosyltransferase